MKKGKPNAGARSGGAPAKPNSAEAVDQRFGIRELAAEFGLTARAIRFYEVKGLVSPERCGTTRLYSRRDRARLGLIKRGKNLGFKLEDIGEFLDLYDADPSLLMQTKHLLANVELAIARFEKKRSDIDRSLTELTEIRGQCIDHLKKPRR